MEMKFGKTTEVERIVNGVSNDYTITARVRVSGDTLASINTGVVTNKQGAQVATFSQYGSLSVNFDTTDASEMEMTLVAINAYTSECAKTAATLATESETTEATEE